MSEHIDNTTDEDFMRDVLKAPLPVLVDFWAEWCGPCRMMAPILEKVAEKYAGRLIVMKMNVDDNNAIPSKMGVRGIPTLMIFKGGQLVSTKVGALSQSQLMSFIDETMR